MRQLKIILLLVAFSCSVFAQDRLSLFISRANKYASVELSDYRKRLCVEYNMSNNSLDDYYRRCGRNWGNVGLALEIARTSGRHMRDVCDYYKRYHRHGWDRVLIEIGIRPGFIIIVTVGMNIIARIVIITINTIISIIKNINTTNIINIINIINGTMAMTMMIGMTMMINIYRYKSILK